MHVTFVVKGGPDSGIGHVYHSTAIADALGEDIDVTFVTPSGPVVQETIEGRGYRVVSVETESDIAATVEECAPDTVVLDVPWPETQFVSRLRERLASTTRIAVFGNRNVNLPSDIDPHCDIIVDFNIGESDHQYQSDRFYDDQTDTLNLIGIHHFVLRPAFYEYAENTFEADGIDRVLVMFGAADPNNYTTETLQRLIDREVDYHIDVVIGPGFSHEDALTTVVEAHSNAKPSVSVDRNVSDVPVRMTAADVVVTSPGLSMIEALLLERPVVAVYQNDLQEIYDGLEFVYGPERLSDITELIRTAPRTFEEQIAELRLEMGRGKQQVIEAITTRLDSESIEPV